MSTPELPFTPDTTPTGSAFFPLPGDVYVGRYGAEVEVVSVLDGIVVIETKGCGFSTMSVQEFVQRAERSQACRKTQNSALTGSERTVHAEK